MVTDMTVQIVAEIGLNFNGDMALAERSVLAARDAGATAVKFQYYRTEDFICDRSLTWEYVSQGRTVVERQYDMFKRCELTRDKMAHLIRYGLELGIPVFATPTSVSAVEELASMGVALMKNGSDYLTHLPLIQAMAKTGITTIISTGMAEEWEVDDAVEAYRSAGGKDLVLMHCTSLYPTPLEAANICRVGYLKDRYDAVVGWSDHTEKDLPAQLAAALGAVFFERHFTLDKELPGPDHSFSSSPDEFVRYVRSIRSALAALGNGRMTDGERANRAAGTLSCVASRDLSRGLAIEFSDVSFCRPGTGIRPKFLPDLIGRILDKDLKKGDVITWKDLR